MPDKIRPSARRKPIAALLDVSFDQAIAYAKTRGVVMPRVYYGKFSDSARAAAFTVSHVASLRQVALVFAELNKTIADGGTFKDFAKRIEAGGIDLGMAHRETIFRTGIQTAYNAGRRDQHKASADDLPVLMYDAINDSRTRPTHRRMDGFMAPVGHPAWLRWYPPNGFNCRCSIIALSAEQAKARGFTGRVGEPGAEPDDGFASDPSDRSSVTRSGEVAARAVADTLPPVVQTAAARYVVRAKPKG